jgi:hypothetical protein
MDLLISSEGEKLCYSPDINMKPRLACSPTILDTLLPALKFHDSNIKIKIEALA